MTTARNIANAKLTIGSTTIIIGSTTSTISALTLSNSILTGTLTANGSVGTTGQVLTSTGTGVQWSAAASGGNRFTYASTAPSSPIAGDIWADSTDGTEYTYVNDGDSNQWVELSNAGLSAAPSTSTTSTVFGTAAEATSSTIATSVGYMGIPQKIITDNYTIQFSDMGKQIYINTGITISVTIPDQSSVNLPIGFTCTIATSLQQASIVTVTDSLIWIASGTTGNRILSQYGMATITKVANNTWYIGGAVLT